MKFGVFDHMDASGLPLDQHYDNRLKIAEAYDRAGIYGYHVAEHHFSPLGQAPSPNVYLAAVARQTQRLRIGPMVYLLAFYNPMRLYEEICMLDHLSRGRFIFGFGRGISPSERRYYSVKAAELQSRFDESLDILLKAFAAGDEFAYDGELYQVSRVPMNIRPFQRPHPPLWYGMHSPDSAVWAAAKDVNFITLGTPSDTRTLTDRYRAEWAKLGKDEARLPLMGVGRHVVIADTDAEARAIACRAYPRWRESFWYTRRREGDEPPVAASYPPDFDALQELGHGFAGSPKAARAWIERQAAATGVNYFVSWLAFGDMTLAETIHSVALFSRYVMPAFSPDTLNDHAAG
jgi:alkanesulfonate monooxygenase SsuD/methylene tetrahydromethanopterin reductase-like flavin-dependent oxidoreductase (luciferase family)